MKSKLLPIIASCAVVFIFFTTKAQALQTYDVSYDSISQAVIHNNNIYFASCDNRLIVEYSIAQQQIIREWQTGDYIPILLLVMPDEEVVVVLNEELDFEYRSLFAVIDISLGSITIHSLSPDIRITSLALDAGGDYIYASCENGLTKNGSIVKIDTTQWLVIDTVESSNYPFGIVCFDDGLLFVACQEPIYTEFSLYHYGPPIRSKIDVYNTVPRLYWILDTIVPEGLNYIKTYNSDNLIAFHVPMISDDPKLSIINKGTLTVDSIAINSIDGIVDGVYYQLLEKIYALVTEEIVGAEDDVPELDYTKDLLVYDILCETYTIYQDYFDSKVGMIDLYEGSIVVNSVDLSKVYVIDPF